MIDSAMLFAGSALLIAWGIAHSTIPVKSIVRGFEPITPDNRRILTMEWHMEGVLLVFLGLLVALVRIFAPEDEIAATIVYRAAALVLIAMAGLSAATGARTRIGPMKLCPPIFLIAALLFWIPAID
jgi:uncharacterized membrane protein